MRKRNQQQSDTRTRPPWTPVSSPPPIGHAVLTWGPHRDFDVLRFRGVEDAQVWETASDECLIEDTDYNPTHWMPLPKRP